LVESTLPFKARVPRAALTVDIRFDEAHPRPRWRRWSWST
jgi:hypothetical protein